jgi:hypothetical protein
MKRILFALLFLFVFSPGVHAWGPIVVGGGVEAAAPSTFCSSATAITTGATGLLCEDFSGAVECTSGYSSNCRGTWVVSSGTPDYDYTTSPAPIEGTYSLFLSGLGNSADTRVYRAFTATGGQPQEMYFTFILTEDGVTPGDFVIARITKDGSPLLCSVTLKGTKTLGVSAGGGTIQYTTGTVTEDTLTHVWVRYLPGSGTDALCTVAFSTDGTRPTSGDNYKESTNGTVTANGNRAELWGDYTSANSGNDIIFDKIFVDDATIGDNP